MKIEKNMFIRTKEGFICKIININEFREPNLKYGVEASYLRDIMFVGDEDVKLASNNLIDLIQVGDYVNGERVIRIFNPTFISMGELPYVITDRNKYENHEIKSILTHEQFEQMKYKIGE